MQKERRLIINDYWIIINWGRECVDIFTVGILY